MPGSHYTVAEVGFLLSIDEEEARNIDAGMGSQLGSLGGEASSGHSSEDPSVFAIARWHDVHDARARVLANRRAESMVLSLSLAEMPQRTIAAAVGISQPTVSRKLKASLTEILEELGGSAVASSPTSRTAACFECCVRPRARVEELCRRWERGRWRLVRTERQASLCAECLEAAPQASQEPLAAAA